MIRLSDIGKLRLVFLAVFVVACSDTSVSDDAVNRNGMDIVATAEELPPCTAENDGEPFFVKSEKIIRVCSDTKWYAIRDEESGENSEKKDSLDSEKGCFVSKETADSLWVSCGDYSFSVPTSGANNGESVVLDSEKIATSLEGVSGFTQKGPFLMGSEVNVIELRDGRTLEQTGDNFEAKIQSDDGQFKLNARMMMSQYLELHAKGYYRNEVSGKNSNAQLTLYALTDVMMRSGGVVNINLLTHLEYHRVIHLVKEQKMKVAAAKDTAEREIFNLLHIDSKDFFSSEDLNIVGSSEGDAALLAFSVMFQGDRDVSQLSALLTSVSTDMEKDGVWNDTKMRDSIADWAENADATGRLAKIRANVEGWGLSAMVPNFEKYIRSFWTKEYGLPTCDKASVDTLVAAAAKRLAGSTNRYICVDSAKVGYMWRRATDLEKDTYGWLPGNDGDMRYGTVNKTARYIYDSRISAWREPTKYELIFGACTDALANDNDHNVGRLDTIKYISVYSPIFADTTWATAWFVCEDHEWVNKSAYHVDTRDWSLESDGAFRLGGYSSQAYVYDDTLGFWRLALEYEKTLQSGCTPKSIGKIAYNSSSNEYYSCHPNAIWMSRSPTCHPESKDYCGSGNYCDWQRDTVAGKVYPEKCDVDGKMVVGKTDASSSFVCDSLFWRRATALEEIYGKACTISNQDSLFEELGMVCDSHMWREPEFYDYLSGYFLKKDYDYGSFIDNRDMTEYKTVTIGNQVWMAENLNYVDSVGNSHLKGTTRCYGRPSDCKRGGRLYQWTAAMDIDQKWSTSTATLKEGLIASPHRGICPNGWHLPSVAEWRELFINNTGASLVASGISDVDEFLGGDNATGFTAVPALGKQSAIWWTTDEGYYGDNPNIYTAFAVYSHIDQFFVYSCSLFDELNGKCTTYNEGTYGDGKVNYYSIRCVHDTPAGN